MEHVADLLSVTAVADVGERFPEQVCHDPEGDDALVNLSELPGAGDDAATIDDRTKSERRAVFLDELLGSKLGEAVERTGSVEGEILTDAQGSNAGCFRVVPREAGLLLGPRMGLEPVDGIDTAGGKKEEGGVPLASLLQAAIGAGEVGFEEVVG